MGPREVVRSQTELDSVCEAFESNESARHLVIELRGDRSMVMPKVKREMLVEAHDTVKLGVFYTAQLHDMFRVIAWDESKLTVYGEAIAEAFGTAQVTAYDKAQVSAYGKSSVTASGSARVTAYENASVVASESCQVDANESTRVLASGRVKVDAYEDATVEAVASATVTAYDRVKVRAFGQTQVDANEDVKVEAYETAVVRAQGEVKVTAGPTVHVWRKSRYVEITGGVVIEEPPAAELVDAADWCAAYGVEIIDRDGVNMAVLYKATGADFAAGEAYNKRTVYGVGTRVECDDWSPFRVCGNGLHFSPRPVHATMYRMDAARWLKVAVPLDELIALNDSSQPKAKAPWCDVLAEVDQHGYEITAKAEESDDE